MGACEEMADSTVQGGQLASQPPSGQIKKRKNNHASSSSFHCGSDLDEETGEDTKSTRTDDNKKQNHSEIEKRRRDKMNTYITELSSMVPMCHAMSRKLDKLTVLRMAVQHLKAIRGHLNSYTEGNYKPSFLSDLQLKQLILQGGEGFLFVVSCDRGRILYVSESVTQALSYSQGELLGQSWFDILHPKDVSKVKEQLTSSDLRPRQTLIDAKTMLPMKAEIPEGVSRLSPGARRSFFCRMKCKIPATIKEEADTTTGSHRKKKQHTSADRRYRVVQCTGYLKSWEAGRGLEEGEADEGLSCLVAVGRLPPPPPPPPTHTPTLLHLTPLQYISRHALDGKFVFVDQRATLVVGYLPQELLGTSMYEYFSHEDIAHLANSHKSALQDSQPLLTQVYRFRERDGNYVHLQSEWKVFRNPWTKEIEYLVAKNSKLQRGDGAAQVESSSVRCESASSLDILSSSTGELARVISSQVEIGQIGRRIADQVRKSSRHQSSPPPGSLSRALLHDRLLLTQDAAAPVSTNLEPPPQGEGDEMMEMMTGAVSPEQVSPSDGNDEAAMAVIMSLLEADAGLGGPVDFTGLPWPLPKQVFVEFKLSEIL